MKHVMLMIEMYRAEENCNKGSFHVSQVMENVCGSLTEVMVETHRRRHLAYLMADHGALINPDHSTNLPKQQLNRFVYLGSVS